VRGQKEIGLFKELTGSDWYEGQNVEIDEEHKITEFDYENHINPKMLKGIDT